MQATPPCFLCGQDTVRYCGPCTDIEYYTTKDRYTFYECPGCKLIQIDPVPVDTLSAIYPSNYYSYQSPKNSLAGNVKEWMDKRLFAKILKRLKGDLRILDVGGGSGWLLSLARSVSQHVKFTQVVDIDIHAAQSARKNGHEYFLGRIEDFNPKRSFDFVLLLNLIEHVGNPLQVLTNIKHLLTEQGIVLIKTPNYDSLDARVFKQNWGGLHCPRHWVIFSKKSIQLLAEKSGLKIRSISYTQGAPFWAVSVLAGMQKRNWVSVNAEKPAVAHPLYPLLVAIFAVFDLLRRPFARTSQMFIVLSR